MSIIALDKETMLDKFYIFIIDELIEVHKTQNTPSIFILNRLYRISIEMRPGMPTVVFQFYLGQKHMEGGRKRTKLTWLTLLKKGKEGSRR